MKKIIIWLITILLAYVLQSSTMYSFSYDGIGTNLVLIILVYLAAYYPDKAILYAFVAGMLQDLASGGFVGIHMLNYMIITWLISLFVHRWYKDNIFLPVFLVSVASILDFLLISLWIYLLGYTYGLVDLVENLLITLGYNLVFAYPVYYIFKYIRRKVESYRRISY